MTSNSTYNAAPARSRGSCGPAYLVAAGLGAESGDVVDMCVYIYMYIYRERD